MRAMTLLLMATLLVMEGAAAAEQHEAAQAHETKATGQLLAEHQATLMVVEAAREEVATIRRTQNVDTERVGKMVDFFRNFTDRCHHAKEETHYFPAAVAYGDEEVRELVEVLQNEHARGRSMLTTIDYLVEETGKEGRTELIAERLQEYAEMIAVHIRKENELLFAKADVYLPQSEQKALEVAFERVEKVELGAGFHEKYHKMAQELAGKSPSEGSASH